MFGQYFQLASAGKPYSRRQAAKIRSVFPNLPWEKIDDLERVDFFVRYQGLVDKISRGEGGIYSVIEAYQLATVHNYTQPDYAAALAQSYVSDPNRPRRDITSLNSMRIKNVVRQDLISIIRAAALK